MERITPINITTVDLGDLTMHRGLWLTLLVITMLPLMDCTNSEDRWPSNAVVPAWRFELPNAGQDLAMWGGRLAVLRRGEGSGALITLHNPSSGRITGRFGEQGLDVSQVYTPFALAVDSATGRLWVLDLMRRRWTSFEDSGSDFVTHQAIQFADPNTVLDPVWWHRSIVASGFYSRGQFALFDSSGALNQFVGKPLEVQPQEETEVAYHLNRARVGVTPDSLIVLARFLRPQLEFYDFSGHQRYVTGNTSGTNNGVEAVEDQFGRAHATPTEDTRYAYVDLSIGSSHVFALYSGRSEKADGPAAVHGNQVVVFSQHGTFERSVPLGTDIDAIQVDEPRGLLYGIGPSAQDSLRGTLYAFPLSAILNWSQIDTSSTNKVSTRPMGPKTPR